MTRTAMPFPIFLVGTRFQAVMANAIRRHCGYDHYDLVYYHHADPGAVGHDAALAQLAQAADTVTPIDRLSSTLQQFRTLRQAVGTQQRIVLLAQISNPFILALFRTVPALRMQSFDEGGFNISRTGPFFDPPRRRLKTPRDLVARALFPAGPLAFAKTRTERHYSAFPPDRNFMADRCEQVALDWRAYLDPAEAHLVQTARTIMVLPCMKDFTGPEAVRDKVMERARTCDLVLRHPRDGDLPDIAATRLNSPVEAIVDAARAHGPVEVFHYASTIGFTLQDLPNVGLSDLANDAA